MTTVLWLMDHLFIADFSLFAVSWPTPARAHSHRRVTRAPCFCCLSCRVSASAIAVTCVTAVTAVVVVTAVTYVAAIVTAGTAAATAASICTAMTSATDVTCGPFEFVCAVPLLIDHLFIVDFCLYAHSWPTHARLHSHRWVR